MSIPFALVKLALYNLVITSLAFKPAFSAKILGNTSKDFANLLKEY